MAGQLAPAPPGAPSAAEWRAAMGYFPTGVTVVTSWREGQPLGATINAICSVSLDPPLLLICLDCANPLCGPIAECGVFGVNILGEEGRELAHRFAAAPEAERFEGQPFRSADGGAPQLDNAPVFIDCRVESTTLAGDHLIVVGRGVRTDHRSGAGPLLYHRGAFPKFNPA